MPAGYRVTAMNTSVSPTALHFNLRRLLTIRLIVFALQLLALVWAWRVLELELRYGAILALFVLQALVNGALYWRLRGHGTPGEGEFFLHLLVDVFGLSLLLYFTGGADNPFVSYFLVPVTIAAATLHWRWAALLALTALACHTLLLFIHQPLPLLQPSEAVMDSHALHGVVAAAAESDSGINLHIMGMWFNFLVSAALVTWFVTQMANEIRRQQERLSRYREDTLRNEQVLAVATLAAGTAHELNTPLGTMTVLLKDLRLEHGKETELDHDLQTLQEQVESCRLALRQLARQADFRGVEREQLPVTSIVAQVLDRWQLLRPEVPCRYEAPTTSSAPLGAVDPTLYQALVNLLNNAADASPEGISLQLDWTAREWRLRLRDHGAGVPRELREQLGIRAASTKEGGMGMGLVLSQATINRFGGRVSLYPLSETGEAVGTVTEVVLPLAGEAKDA